MYVCVCMCVCVCVCVCVFLQNFVSSFDNMLNVLFVCSLVWFLTILKALIFLWLVIDLISVKTHEIWKERFLSGRNRTTRAKFSRKSSFSSYVQHKNRLQKKNSVSHPDQLPLWDFINNYHQFSKYHWVRPTAKQTYGYADTGQKWVSYSEVKETNCIWNKPNWRLHLPIVYTPPFRTFSSTFCFFFNMFLFRQCCVTYHILSS